MSVYRARSQWLWSWVVVVALLLPATAHAQICGPNVPVVNVDLSASPASTFQTPNIQRQGQCCGVTAPDQCLQFVITLHPDAQGINFQICAGAVPPGALFYQIACGPEIQVGQAICLDGAGPHILTFCKPGNNTNQYCITSIPAPSAGPGITLNDGCTGTITSTGFAPGTIEWTSVVPGAPGAYDDYLACPTCANTTVTGQTGAPAYVDYQICGNAIAPCSSNSYCDTVRVYFNPTLVVAIEPELPTVCFGAAGTTITAVGGGGSPPYSFQWSTGATTESIFVGPGTYSVLMSDATDCPPTNTEVLVTQFEQPIEAIPGDDILVCGQAATVALNGTVTGASGGVWSGGSGTFAPSPEALDAVYSPTADEIAAGSMQLILTTTGNGTCPGDEATLTITFAAPFENVGISATDADCAQSADGTVTVAPTLPGWTYAWAHDPALNTANATGLTAANYSVMVTDPSGCTIDLGAVVGAPAPLAIAEITVTDESCAGAGDGSVTVSATGGTAPYAYLWSNGATINTTAAGAGTYSVVVADANGCTAPEASATVVALGQPNLAHAGSELVGCLNALPVQLNGDVTNAAGGEWSGGDGTFIGMGLNAAYQPTVAEIMAGGVELVLTTTGNGTCPPGTDTLQVLLSNSFLGASTTTTGVLCHGEATGTAAFLPDGPGLTFLWNDVNGQTTAIAGGLAAGTYSVQVTDDLGCDTVMTASVVEPAPLVLDIAESQDPACHGGQDGWATASVAGGTAPYVVAWTGDADPQEGLEAIGLGAGTHLVTVTDAHGCTSSADVVLGEPSAITLSAQVPDTVCVNAPVMLSATAMGGQGSHTIIWEGIGEGASLEHAFAADQTISVTVVDGAGCQGPQLEFIVTVLDLSLATLTVGGDTTICPGGTALPLATLTGYPGSHTFSWPGTSLSGPGPHTVHPLADSVFTVVVTDVCGNSLDGTVEVLVEHPPVIDLPELLAEGCAPLEVNFPDLGLPGPLSYAWDLGDGSSSSEIAPTHTYGAGTFIVQLTVTTPAGCVSSAAAGSPVVVHTPPTAAFSASPWSTDIDDPTIVFTDQSSGDIVQYWWDFGDGGTSAEQHPEHDYSDIGDHLVQLWIEDANGCEGEVAHIVRIDPAHELIIPNAFTPNTDVPGDGNWIPGDLSNDVFYPFARFVEEFHMMVFNRWGEMVFESHDIRIGWNGWYRGQPSQQDVYAYRVRVRFVDGKEMLRLGDVTLFR